MNNEQRTDWRRFHLSEQKLFTMINKQCECLYTTRDDQLRYIEFKNQHGTILNKPPRFIHWIGHLDGDASEIKEQIALMKAHYFEAIGKDKFTKFPVRFPVFYNNVVQINITQHLAYSSVKVEGDYVAIKTYFDDRDIPTDLAIVRATGFSAAIRDDVLYKSLVISTDELYEFAKTSQIQMRKLTGTQYRATIRFAGDSRGFRTMLGLILIDQDSNPDVVFPAKEAPRPHSLEATGHEIILPFKTSFRFFKR